jgi:hypothetical protein
MKSSLCTILLILVASLPLPALPPVQVTVTVDSSHPAPALPDDYAGLSYETKREMPDEAGKYYFSGNNTALATMFRTLGIKNLRIGGNMVDSQKVPIPAIADIDQLFGFAKAADAKVIYSFRLHNGDPAGSATQAKYIADHYAANLLCFSIGNEPDIYIYTWDGYMKHFQPIYDAINQAVPDAKYCGPSLTSNARPWAHDFAAKYFPEGKILYIGQHEYAGGAGGKQKDPVAGRDLMLSPAWHDTYQTYYDKLVPGLNKVPYRLEEANNFYNGGAQDISDTFASALWGLDYLYWYAAHGAQGINFHNGDQVAAGQQLAHCRYASFTSLPDGYFAHPLAYAIKMFNLGSKGQMVTTNVKQSQPIPMDNANMKPPGDLNFEAYSVLGADKNLYVTLINKEHNSDGRDADVTIQTGGNYTKAESIALTAPNGDVSAKDGITLGGAGIAHDGTLKESWNTAPAPSGGALHITVPACSVLLVRLH